MLASKLSNLNHLQCSHLVYTFSYWERFQEYMAAILWVSSETYTQGKRNSSLCSGTGVRWFINLVHQITCKGLWISYVPSKMYRRKEPVNQLCYEKTLNRWLEAQTWTIKPKKETINCHWKNMNLNYFQSKAVYLKDIPPCYNPKYPNKWSQNKMLQNTLNKIFLHYP